MAFIELYRDKLKKNYNYLDQLFKTNNIEWAVVSKLLCGNELYLKELLKLNIKEICDARVSNLVKIKKLAPEIDTVYIKPPAKRSIKKIVKYADASFNTEFETIKWLSEEAVKQSKIHKIIIMIELGDLREGVMGEDLMDFYGSIFKLPNIKVTGIGTNLNCLHGVYPSEDKMVQLSLYKQLIESKFNRKIPWVTGGTSVVIPLLLMKQLPAGINHFRVGEALFFGNNLITGETFKGMETDVFKLFAEVIEITEKPINPIGNMGENPSGEEFEVNPEDYGKTHHRAIIDLGVLDVANSDLIIPEDKNITIVGASSDMLVLDIEKSDKDYHIGDLISFRLKYMGA
ncbi:MAG: alanine racemase, partial [Flavobacteriales bacterium]|nr:alanine racemase [Flavobacteriales bacterium]